jgi:hypothetical protein
LDCARRAWSTKHAEHNPRWRNTLTYMAKAFTAHPMAVSLCSRGTSVKKDTD